MAEEQGKFRKSEFGLSEKPINGCTQAAIGKVVTALSMAVSSRENRIKFVEQERAERAQFDAFLLGLVTAGAMALSDPTLGKYS